MEIIKTTNNNEYEVNMNADMFIVPNNASAIADFFFMRESEKNIILRLDPELNLATDKLVEIWICNEECDNFGDHSIILNINDSKYAIMGGSIPNFLPAKMIKDLKEGETMTVTYMLTAEKLRTDEDETISIKLNLNLTAKQKMYRYRSFGTFEETFAYVTI